MIRVLKFTLQLLIFLFIIANAYILISGKTYVYKAIKVGYLKGHNTATIEDFSFFENRKSTNKENNFDCFVVG